MATVAMAVMAAMDTAMVMATVTAMAMDMVTDMATATAVMVMGTMMRTGRRNTVDTATIVIQVKTIEEHGTLFFRFS